MKRRILALSRDRGSMQAIAPVIAALKASDVMEVVTYATQESWRVTIEFDDQARRLDETAFAADPGAHVRKLFDTHEPDLVLSGLSPIRGAAPETPEQFAILEARRRGLPSLAVQDYWGMYAERFSRDGEVLDGGLLPDRLCVLDRRACDDLQAFGVPRQRMAITHNPWLDRLVKESAILAQRSSASSVVLLASQPLAEMQHLRSRPYDQYTLFDCLLAAIPKAGTNRLGTAIHVLLHPSEDQGRWEAQLAGNRRFDVEVKLCRFAAPELLRDADYIVTSHSTLAYEALYFGTPCISLRPATESLPHTWIDDVGLSQVFHEIDSLRHYLESSDPVTERRNVLRLKHQLGASGLFFSDGKATGRVVKEVFDLLGLTAAI